MVPAQAKVNYRCGAERTRQTGVKAAVWPVWDNARMNHGADYGSAHPFPRIGRLLANGFNCGPPNEACVVQGRCIPGRACSCRCDGAAVGTGMFCNKMGDCREFLLARCIERDGKCARVEGSNTPQGMLICPLRAWRATTPGMAASGKNGPGWLTRDCSRWSG